MSHINYELIANNAATLGNMLAKASAEYDAYPITENLVLDLLLPGYIKMVKERIKFVNSGEDKDDD